MNVTLKLMRNPKRKFLLDDRMRVKSFEDGSEILHPLGAYYLEVIFIVACFLSQFNKFILLCDRFTTILCT